METRYALLSFGIPVHDLPLAMPSNNLKTKSHLKWMKMRYHLEQLTYNNYYANNKKNGSSSNNNNSKSSATATASDDDDTGHPKLDVESNGGGGRSIGSSCSNKKRKKKSPDNDNNEVAAVGGSTACCYSDDRSPALIVECPTTWDVLFANGGKAWMKHEGNVQFVQILEQHIPAYIMGGHKNIPPPPSQHISAADSSSTEQPPLPRHNHRQDQPKRHAAAPSTAASSSSALLFRNKKSVLSDIIKTVTRRGGRFLSWEEEYGWWVILEQPALDVKVRRSLLDHNRRLMDRKQRVQRRLPRPCAGDGLDDAQVTVVVAGGGPWDGFLPTNSSDEDVQSRLTRSMAAVGGSSAHRLGGVRASMERPETTTGDGCLGCFGTEH